MPDVLSVGLGGGSLVQEVKKENNQVRHAAYLQVEGDKNCFF